MDELQQLVALVVQEGLPSYLHKVDWHERYDRSEFTIFEIMSLEHKTSIQVHIILKDYFLGDDIGIPVHGSKDNK